MPQEKKSPETKNVKRRSKNSRRIGAFILLSALAVAAIAYHFRFDLQKLFNYPGAEQTAQDEFEQPDEAEIVYSAQEQGNNTATILYSLPLKRTSKSVWAVNNQLKELKSDYQEPAAVEIKTVKTPYNLGGVKVVAVYPGGFLYDDTVAFVFDKDIFEAGAEVSPEKLISIPGLSGAERRLNGNTVKYFVESDTKYGRTYQGSLTYQGKQLEVAFIKPLLIGAYYQVMQNKPCFIVTPLSANGARGADAKNSRPLFADIKKILEEQLYIEAAEKNKIVKSSVTVEQYDASSYLIKPRLDFSKNLKLTLKSFPQGFVQNVHKTAAAFDNGYDNRSFVLEKVISTRRILSSIDFVFSKRVTQKEFVQNIKITPWPEGLDLENLYNDNYYYSHHGATKIELPTAKFAQGVTYNFIISADLKNSVDAKKLNEEIEFEIVLREAPPALELETGINIVEAKFPYYSFKLRNISTVNVAVFKADKNNVIETMQSGLFSSGSKEKNVRAKLSSLGRPVSNYRVTHNLDSYIWYEKIDLKQPGVYLVTIEPAKTVDGDTLHNIQPQSAIVNVTNLGLIGKKSLKNIAVWATNLDTGQPAADVEITLYDGKRKKIAAVKTNNDGYCIVPLGLEKLKEDIYVVASKGKDTAIIATTARNFDSNLEPWEFGIYQIDFDKFLKSGNKRYFVVSDSPIYKPGAEINYKLYVREYNENDLDYSRGNVTVVIRDPQWNVIYEKELKLKSDSSAADRFRLKSDCRLGEYAICIKNNGGYSRIGSFLTADYRAPKTKFRVKSARNFTYPDAVEQIDISADYYSGQPIKNAPIKLSYRYQDGGYYRDWDSPYSSYKFYQSDYFSSTARKENLKSGPDGKLTWQHRILNQPLKEPIVLALEFTLQDTQGLKEKVSQYLNYTVYPAEFKIGIRQKGFSSGVKETSEFEFITLSNENKLVRRQIEYAVFIDKVYTVREKGVGNSYEYLNAITPEKVAEGQLTTSELNPAVWRKAFARAGHYYILAKGVDESGRITTTQLDFYVHSGNYNWGRYNHDRIDILTDKETYDVGDELKVLIKSPYSTATGIVTIETNSVIEYQLIKINNNAPVINLKVKEQYYPNCYISVCLVQGRTDKLVKVSEAGLQQVDLGKPSFKIGYQQIKVRKKERDIKVQASAEKQEYSPGDKVKVNVSFSNAKHAQPTNYCALVVNNALFDLASLKTNIGEAMNPAIPLLVKNYTNYNRIVGRRLFGKKGAVAGGGGGLADSDQTRKEFKDIIYFAPYLQSTAEQTGSFSFSLPDNAGEFRVVIFADNGPDVFGYGQLVVKSTQTLLIENALPAFLRSTDKSRGGVIVFNNTNTAQTCNLEARWDLDGMALDSAAKNFTIADRAQIDLDIQIPEFYQEAEKTLNVLTAARTKLNKDRVQFTLPVYRNASKKVTAINTLILTDQNGRFSCKTNLKLTEPAENLIASLSQASLSFDRDVADLIKEPAEYLVYYPHACWEQKLGMLLGNAVMYKSPQSSREQQKEALKNIELIFAENNKYKNPNGFYGYWPGGAGYSYYLTVYTLAVLNQVKSLGIGIDETMLQNLLKTLKAELASGATDTYQARLDKHYLLYELALAGENVLAFIEQRGKSELTIEDKLYRLYLLHKYQVFPGEMESLKKEIIANIYVDQSGRAMLKQGRFFPWRHNTDVKLTALALRLLAEIPEMESYTLQLLDYILSEKRHNNRWYNTHDNAQVIIAMQSIRDKYFSGQLNCALRVDDETIYTGQVNNEVKTADLDIAKFSGVRTVATEVTASGQANKAAFYKLEVTQYLKKLNKHEDKSFRVRTEYFDLNRKRVKSFKKGENYIVRINFNSYEDNTFVVCADKLPAALLPIDFNQLNTQSTLAGSLKSNVWPSYTEIRQDRAGYYFDFLPRGSHYVEYAAQAIAAGDYFDPGAYAENMYAPDVRGAEKDDRITCD